MTSGGPTGSGRLEETPQPSRAAAPAVPLGEAIDSMYAQAVADRAGPRVSIRAEVSQLTSSRRLRARFNVEDDAYVLVGHVDAGGVLRIVFPAQPQDDGFVQGGGRSYQTSEFFAGFSDQYTFRYANYGRFNGTQPDAYDGSGGYLFIVASWRPMHYEKLADGDHWESFEVTDEAYVRDPRPAIYELASVLVGEKREAYTVKFASYYNSQNMSPFSAYSDYSAFGLGLCNASFNGWGQSIPWSYLSTAAPFITEGLGYDQIFQYRGREYMYDSFANCASALPFGFGRYGYGQLASGPGRPTKPTDPTAPGTDRGRMLGVGDSRRNPFEPKPVVGGRLAPATARDASTASQGTNTHLSSEYRNRGLITEDRPETGMPSRRTPRIGADAPVRPSIQEMTRRREENAHEGSAASGRARVNAGDPGRASAERPQPIDRARNRGGEQPSGTGRVASPRQESPRVESPRVESPRPSVQSRPTPPPAPRSEPRTAPPMRTAEPRSSEPASRPTTPVTPVKPPAAESGSAKTAR